MRRKQKNSPIGEPFGDYNRMVKRIPTGDFIGIKAYEACMKRDFDSYFDLLFQIFPEEQRNSQSSYTHCNSYR